MDETQLFLAGFPAWVWPVALLLALSLFGCGRLIEKRGLNVAKERGSDGVFLVGQAQATQMMGIILAGAGVAAYVARSYTDSAMIFYVGMGTLLVALHQGLRIRNTYYNLPGTRPSRHYFS